LLKRTFLVLLRLDPPHLRMDLDLLRLDLLRLDLLRLDLLRLDLLRLDLDPLRLRLPPSCIDMALDDTGEGVGFAATPEIFFFKLSKESVIFPQISLIYIY
jgi:hypothetical protein